jgi:hypothetical protein
LGRNFESAPFSGGALLVQWHTSAVAVPKDVRRCCANFSYWAASWAKARRVIEESSVHPKCACCAYFT